MSNITLSKEERHQAALLVIHKDNLLWELKKTTKAGDRYVLKQQIKNVSKELKQYEH